MADEGILYPDDLQEMAEEAEEEYTGADDENYEEDDDYESKGGYYKESVFFDGNDFARDFQNRVRGATGVEAYEQWCRTCIATEKGSLMCYPDDFGVDMERVRAAKTFDEAVAILVSEIERALLADTAERTQSVESIEVIKKTNDSIVVAVSVIGSDEATRDIVTTIDERL